MIRSSHANAGQTRRDRTLRPRPHDNFSTARKPTAPCTCPDCGAAFHRGRWSWEPAPPEASKHLCPACVRIRGRAPKAALTLRGEWFAAHRDEILSLIDREARLAREAHPLSRVMGISTQDDGSTQLTTTDGHLARRLAEALSRAGGGALEVRCDRDGKYTQMVWER